MISVVVRVLTVLRGGLHLLLVKVISHNNANA